VFDEVNVEGVEDSVCRLIPQAVRFGVRGVADHFARHGSLKNFRVVSGYERVRAAANFA
jgi:hypothetical protein